MAWNILRKTLGMTGVRLEENEFSYSRKDEPDMFAQGMIEGGITSGGFKYKGKRIGEWSVLDGDQSLQAYKDEYARMGAGQIGVKYFNPTSGEPYVNKFVNIDGMMYKTNDLGEIVKVDKSFLRKELDLVEKEEKRLWAIVKMFKSDSIMAKALTVNLKLLQKLCDVDGLQQNGLMEADSPLASTIDKVNCLPSISSMYPAKSQEQNASLMKMFYLAKKFNPIITDPEENKTEPKKPPANFKENGDEDEGVINEDLEGAQEN